MRRALALLLVCGCGRLGFDGATHDGDTGSDAGAPDAATISGLVASYPMDDDPQSGAIGSPDLPATCTGTCPTHTTGVHGGAYHFDGTQYFFLPSTTLVGSAPYSVALWVNVADGVDLTGIPFVNKPFSPTTISDAGGLLVHGGVASYETTIDGNVIEYTEPTTALTVAVWHHIAGTWDGSTKTLYVDGAAVATDQVTVVDSSESVEVGVDTDTGVPSFFMTGDLDELRFYDRALDASEVMLLAQ